MTGCRGIRTIIHHRSPVTFGPYGIVVCSDVCQQNEMGSSCFAANKLWTKVRKTSTSLLHWRHTLKATNMKTTNIYRKLFL